ncbi:hypothetical protein EUTSA_v10024113mg [Eutrema salsugineum]|uniref:NAD(+) kinase n=1 Tax=Eutrema salsugineum TaxID=72664 RepID=V4KDH9_EUTSA|nr:hypothetical protein EUTSA_v10024121mg [Eutrema salsugineum]ESQ29174.1 hypothetical protein EUTSA_v10024113mg [Eutrema salsugineum]
MCASATGVVRVQSRKKAEMFLVPTDGVSCTREKVTESSLAFTHTSTQQIPGFGFARTFYIQDTSDLHGRVDFVACLGADGLILHASNLFKGAVPPVVSFNLGSLGFLTLLTLSTYFKRVIILGNNSLDLFECCLYPFGLISYVRVIVPTPTGRTAYSTAAGGSMVHPNVPCMLFTPIRPHSMSFRPVILPDSAKLELKTTNAWVSFDGKRRQQLSRGDSVRIYMSQHPLPTVNKSDQTGDWFRSLIPCLNWNALIKRLLVD